MAIDPGVYKYPYACRHPNVLLTNTADGNAGSREKPWPRSPHGRVHGRCAGQAIPRAHPPRMEQHSQPCRAPPGSAGRESSLPLCSSLAFKQRKNDAFFFLILHHIFKNIFITPVTLSSGIDVHFNSRMTFSSQKYSRNYSSK